MISEEEILKSIDEFIAEHRNSPEPRRTTERETIDWKDDEQRRAARSRQRIAKTLHKGLRKGLGMKNKSLKREMGAQDSTTISQVLAHEVNESVEAFRDILPEDETEKLYTLMRMVRKEEIEPEVLRKVVTGKELKKLAELVTIEKRIATRFGR